MSLHESFASLIGILASRSAYRMTVGLQTKRIHSPPKDTSPLGSSTSTPRLLEPPGEDLRRTVRV